MKPFVWRQAGKFRPPNRKTFGFFGLFLDHPSVHSASFIKNLIQILRHRPNFWMPPFNIPTTVEEQNVLVSVERNDEMPCGPPGRCPATVPWRPIACMKL